MPPPSKRRKTSAVDEITFDDKDRTDFLTGFRRRKQARIRHAQEVAAQKEKEERQRERRELRERRKRDLERHVAEVNAILRKQSSENEYGDRNGSSDEDEWSGLSEDETATPPREAPIRREDEYVDEDKYTTVTVSEVGITRDGFEEARSGSSDDGKGDEDKEKESRQSAVNGRGKLSEKIKREAKEKQRPKKKKKKFRYETKAERKLGRIKDRMRKSAKAKARRGENNA
ncbi:nucleolar protein 12-domain-containing protein [Lineolata rhizophorae]|uniref:Nucleolar protein 12-domain-containing protein n=1 Tax=Lineolata rhizophorae TaxID=578093 RepID=A0A6A6NT92_9PEZI|nr:nucleolar protein 12-domain-containing protein [Lineolata rhizophorae]